MIAPATDRVAGLLPFYSWVPCANAGCPLLLYVEKRRKAIRCAERARAEAGRMIEVRNALRRADPHCRYCGRRVRRSATLDHVLPRSRGGTDAPENVVLACRQCNEAKGARTQLEWAADILAAVRL